MTPENNNQPWGATAADWSLFADKLGLKADLLPVVSNPQAVISKDSKMAALGKTPSQYNRSHEAVGIAEWTQRQTDDRMLARWVKDSDLGICVQTRSARAIDIDVPDASVAQRVRDVIELVLDQVLPMRWRADTGKCLLAFRMPGEFTKRIIRMAGDDKPIIEFLANGQQFIAVGAHIGKDRVSRTRYQWDWPDGVLEIPELSSAQFEGVWNALTEAFAIEPTATGRGIGQRPVVPRHAGAASDAVVDFLEATGWVKNWQKDGRVNIRCPWEAEHTSDSGDTATVWFPAGVGGFDQGHFRCLHAHCETRRDEDFLDSVGYVQSAFDVVDLAADTLPGEVVERAKPVFQRKRNGAILGSLVNAQLALDRADLCGMHLAYDGFLDALMCAAYDPAVTEHAIQWRAFTDTDYTTLRLHLEQRQAFEAVGRETIKDAVHWVAERNRIDSAVEWLTHRVPAWDGTERIDGFFPRYFSTADTPYTRACSAYLWTALAGRTLLPGVQADMVPVLIGKQGLRKTTGVKALVPSPEQFVELSLQAKDEELARKMRGKLVGELGELRGLNSRDGDSIKQWITRTHEEWVPKFKEFSTRSGRRLVLVGTVNREQFLADDEGEERRWLPMRVGQVDTDAIEQDRDQLWAEARERFLAGGVEWRDAEELARGVHGDHRVTDLWAEPVAAWLTLGEMDDASQPRGLGEGGISATEVLLGALAMPVSRISKGDEMRVGKVLRQLGFEKKKVWFNGGSVARWFATETCRFLHTKKDVFDLA